MKDKKNIKNIISIIIIIIILIIIIWLGIEKYKETKIEDKEIQQYSIKNLNRQDNQETQEENKTDKKITEYPKEEIIKQYKGYQVAAKLEIPKIELETYILQKYSEKALNVSITKFWGVNPNEIGNFCVAGHNFKNKNMFHNLKELEKCDRLFVSDNKIGKIEYEIYDLYKVQPEDISCLSQETNGKREITLITCTNDSKKRIIVKARELEM